MTKNKQKIEKIGTKKLNKTKRHVMTEITHSEHKEMKHVGGVGGPLAVCTQDPTVLKSIHA